MMADPERVERHRKARREQARRRRERAKTDPDLAERLRGITKRHYDKIRNDPETWELKVIDQRIRYRGKNDPRFLHTDANAAYKGNAHKEDMVDAEPFLAFVREVFPDASTDDLAELFGLSSRRFREFNEGKTTASLDLIDRAFTKGLGRPDLVAVLYPLEAA